MTFNPPDPPPLMIEDKNGTKWAERLHKDSTHIAVVEHYKSLVFGPNEAYTAGNFVEETFGATRPYDGLGLVSCKL